VETQTDQTAVSIDLSILGVALLLIAANGRRISEFSRDGVGFSKVSPADVRAAEKQSEVVEINKPSPVPQEPPQQILATDGATYQVFRPVDIPLEVITDALGELKEPPADLSAFQAAYRKKGKGNHSWLLKMRDGNTIKVSYGGKGKQEATVDS
jgi:hypothetical protein